MNKFYIFFLLSITIATSQAQLVFQKTYGLVGYNYGRNAYQLSDGGYIILGNKTGFSGNTDIYLIRTDTLGKIIWDKAIGSGEVYWANDFKVTSDSGFIIAGYTNILFGNGYDVLLIKTDSLGNIQWSKTYGGTDWDMGHSVIQDKNGDYLVCGESYSNSIGDADVYVVKTNPQGDTLWTKHYGGTGTDIGYSIDTTYTPSYVIAGVTRKLTDTTYDAYLMSIKNNGDTIFTKKYGDTLDDKFYCARAVDDTSFIICGSTINTLTNKKVGWSFKTDTLGSDTWQRVYTPVLPDDEEFFDIKRNWNGGFVMVGITKASGLGSKDVHGFLIDNAGWFFSGTTCGGAYNDEAYSVNLTKDSCYIFTGTTWSFGLGLSNIYFIKTNKVAYSPGPPTQEIGIKEEEAEHKININVFPNPTADIAFITSSDIPFQKVNLGIYNILGELILSKDIENRSMSFQTKIDLSTYADGVYFIQVKSQNYISTTKIIKHSKD